MSWIALIPSIIVALIAAYCLMKTEDKNREIVDRIWCFIFGITLFIVSVWLCEVGVKGHDYGKNKNKIEQPFLEDDYYIY